MVTTAPRRGRRHQRVARPLNFSRIKGVSPYWNTLKFYIGEPVGIRTRDPMIKSHVLYRLSYGLTRRCG